MTVNVSGTGPFVITSQNTDNLSWFQGQNNTINWSVNNTNTLPGSANVNIRLSVDGELLFHAIGKVPQMMALRR
jgi:N-acetylmuramic acid 6-phosphate (MurNAc-6-P) etherase